ncbi:hypothetical protein [Pontimicrobium sp. IMCC45349]|uniref:hypothetical protein n=1 Tax=Pontimicrobium sp. IMCC45349 TaxID=3391574 RepID=UPI0039A0A7C5
MNLIFIAFILTTFFSCKAEVESDLTFAFSIDKDGVYVYSLSEKKAKHIYSTDKIFQNDYFKLINDSVIQVGHQSKKRSETKQRKVYSKYLYRTDGDSTFITNNPPYTVQDNYDYLTDSIYHINIKSNNSFLASIKDYEHYDHSTIKIKTQNFDHNGKLIFQKNTSFACGGTSSSSKGIRFCDFKRFFSESKTVLGKKIVSERGDLIIYDGISSDTLLKFDGHFDPKFGSGYYNPTLSNDGKKTSFQYLAGFFNNGSCIYEMDIDTRNKTKLILYHLLSLT